jgi:hypothetical protein
LTEIKSAIIEFAELSIFQENACLMKMAKSQEAGKARKMEGKPQSRSSLTVGSEAIGGEKTAWTAILRITY